MYRKLFALIIFAIVAILAYTFIEVPFSNKHFVTINGFSLEIELANTPYLRNKGLMGRQHLDKHKGMLFVFKTADRHSFWNKNTLIPLSLAFIRKDGTITDILRLPVYDWKGKSVSASPKHRVPYVLEVNQGWFEKNRVQTGDRVYFSRSIQKAPVK